MQPSGNKRVENGQSTPRPLIASVRGKGRMLKRICNRTIGWLAILTPMWFAVIYFVMSSLHPNYSHSTKAISELGSLDAPNRWAWNIGGYILPGLAISLLGVGLARHFDGEKGASWVARPLMASGLFMAMSGVFPGDFLNRTSPTMLLHAIGAFGSFIAFLVCAFSAPALLRRYAGWRAYVWPSTAIVILSIASGFFRSGNAPGLGQRMGFLLFFMWIGLLGYGLIRNSQPVRSTA